jgi:hypothetical protein
VLLAAVLAAVLVIVGAPAGAAGTVGAKSMLRLGVTTPGGPLASAEIAEVAQLAGEQPSIEMWFEDFTQPAPLAKLDAVVSRGATPVLTWEPWEWNAGPDQPRFALDRISAGDFDDYITGWAIALQAWGQPLYLRFGHEMNGSWYPWAEGVNGNGSGDYVTAWRHVHDIFTRVGADNVAWMWCANVPYQGSTPLSGLYPGARYVDAVALDGYNFGASQPWSSWVAPQDLFGAGLSQLRTIAPRKPVVIAETASTEIGGSKPAWITALVPYLAGQSGVIGFVWFQHDKETDWRFSSSGAAGAAFAQALAARR